MKLERAWFRRLPEVRRLEDDALARRAFEALAARSFGHARATIWMIGLIGALSFSATPALTVLAVYPALGRIPWLAAIPPPVRAIVGITLTLVVFYVLLYWLWHRPMQRAARQELQRLGVPVCVACGYDCRGSTPGRCPECGASARV